MFHRVLGLASVRYFPDNGIIIVPILAWRAMKKTTSIYFLVIAALLAACSTEISDQPAANTPIPAEATVSTPPSPAVATPTPAARETVGPAPSDAPPSPGLDLSGSLYYIGFDGQQQKLFKLDLFSGQETIFFAPPENAWLSEVAVSPDGSQILLAYSPPPEGGQIQYGFTDLYLMPADGSGEPTPLLQRVDPSETFFNLSWPVDDAIYYAHFSPSVDDSGIITYASQIERLRYPDGSVEVLAKDAAWPRLSDDGAMLAYVTEDNEFILAGADGSDPRPILDPETFSAVDAPLFSPDGSLICFSAVEPSTASLPSLWDRLLGVKLAFAHSVPSDWWCMTVDGSGDPQRLTNLNAIGLSGDFDDGGQHMAFVTAAGVHVMNQDGTGILQLRDIVTTGTIDWVP
jgi:hypothetical protein